MIEHSAQESQATRERLLRTAAEVFAEVGFRDATVRDICHRAGANVAAINYHFGDKETIYREALAECARQAMQRYPIGAGLPSDPTPEAELRAFIRNYLDRLLDDGRPAWHGRLISREIVEPTPALDDIVREFIRPQFERLCGIVTRLLGASATPERVRHFACSVVGQCLYYKLCRPIIERVAPEQGFGAKDREALTEHIHSFSMHAARAAVGGERGASCSGSR